jgi:acyl carrier protein
MPVNPNGKLDRKALPAPSAAHAVSTRAYVAPRTDVEHTLADIWCEVLRLEKVGVHDNFFELGGHSLLATQVMSRIQETFEVNLPLKKFFEVSTIDELAVLIDAQLIEQISMLSDEDAEAMVER